LHSLQEEPRSFQYEKMQQQEVAKYNSPAQASSKTKGNWKNNLSRMQETAFIK
jgi:hypothetical protein